jgi:hypothetical protein
MKTTRDTRRERDGRRSLHMLGPMLAAATLMGIPALPRAQNVARGDVTFTKDIAPVVQRSCENCHRKGGVAPMSLSTYVEARPWARAMKRATSAGEMPPWFIDRNIGIQKFKDDISLSEEEIGKIARWADSGAPQGNPADMPPPRHYPDPRGWTIGPPDLIVSSPVMIVKPSAPDWHGEVGPVLTGLTEDRYVQAVETKEVRLNDNGLPDEEGFKRVRGAIGDLNFFSIHHMGVRETDPRTGEDLTEVSEGLNRGFYAIHEVGTNATIYPKDAGNLLTARTAFVYTAHLHSVGREVRVRLDVGFKFHPKGWTPKYPQAGILTMGGPTEVIDIPAGQDNVSFQHFYKLPRNAMLTTFEPHMHSSGKRMCVEAIYPDMRRDVLNCAGYNHNWVKVYAYEDDVAPLLPAGTIIHYTGWYDNTSNNRRVVDPRNWKGWGNRSIDDMFLFRPRVVFLTDEQFKEKLAERQAKPRRSTHNP